eukprot:GSChrysophyteH2.ASY1.ANO1.864.1 assembled CDS
MELLTRLVEVQGVQGHGLQRSHLELVFADLVALIRNSKLASLRIQQLQLLALLVNTHAPADIQGLVSGETSADGKRGDFSLLPTVIACAKEGGYKNISVTLEVLNALIPKLRPLAAPEGQGLDGDGEVIMADTAANTAVVDVAAYARQIYDAVLPHYEAPDVDQETKKHAIQTIASLFYYMGDQGGLEAQLPAALTTLEQRIDNEITRVSALRALAFIAKSPLPAVSAGLSRIDRACLMKIAGYARQQSRETRVTCMQTLNAFVQSCFQQALFSHVYHLATTLASSPFTHGSSQRALEAFLKQLVSLSLQGMSFEDVATEGSAANTSAVKKQSGLNIARCIAAICSNATKAQNETVARRFVADIASPTSSNAHNAHLALLCIGEMGRRTDMAALTSDVAIETCVMAQFAAPAADTQVAAAFALGSLAVGNMGKYLPALLQALQSETVANKYLPLAALRELIQAYTCADSASSAAGGGSDLATSLPQIMPALLPAATSTEAQIRNVAAECLGLLTNVHPELMLPQLDGLFAEGSSHWHARWTLATALNEEIEVRKAAVLATSSAIHRNASLILAPCTNSLTDSSILDNVLPDVISAMQCRHLIEVDTGIFKVKEDLGLTLRTSALACVDTLIDTLPEKVVVSRILPAIRANTGDELKVKDDTSYVEVLAVVLCLSLSLSLS